MTDVHKP